MPFLMPAQTFAEQALNAIERGDAMRAIPWQMGWVGRILSLLPNAVFDKIFAQRKKKIRAPSASAKEPLDPS
jgi:hypothetical protein